MSFIAVELSYYQWINYLFMLVCRETKYGKFEEARTNNFIIVTSLSMILTYNGELQTKWILSCFISGKASISPSIILWERINKQRVNSSLSDQHLVGAIW